MAKIYAIDGKLIYEKKGASDKETVASAIKDGVSLEHADLKNSDLTGSKLDGISFAGADLSECDIPLCSFVGANFKGADLSSARAWKTDFKGADMEGARLHETDLNESILDRANLKNASFSKANLWGASIRHAVIAGASMEGANIYTTKFDHTDLGTVSFRGAVVGFSGSTDSKDWETDVDELNDNCTVAKMYGWRVEVGGPGSPSKWNGEWEALFVCTRVAEPGGFTSRPKDTHHVLADRAQRYGSFEGHAAISQALQKVVYKGFAKRVDGKTAQDMTDAQREALFMILHKIARIVNGDFNYDDSWRDIAGYATLVTNLLGKEKTE